MPSAYSAWFNEHACSGGAYYEYRATAANIACTVVCLVHPAVCLSQWACPQGSVEERIMEMVQQRKEGLRSQEPSTSRGLTWADLGQPAGSDRNQVCTAQHHVVADYDRRSTLFEQFHDSCSCPVT